MGLSSRLSATTDGSHDHQVTCLETPRTLHHAAVAGGAQTTWEAACLEIPLPSFEVQLRIKVVGIK